MTNFEFLSIIIASFSFFISIIALLFTKKDKPNFMPCGEDYNTYINVNHLSLKWSNTSEKVIHDLTLMMNMAEPQRED